MPIFIYDVFSSSFANCRKKEQDELKRAQFPHFGPKFRYSGRTHYQVTDGACERPRRTAFTKINRKASARFTGARALAVDTGGEFTLTVMLV